LGAIAAGDIPYPAMIYGRLISAYRNGNADEFNKVLREYSRYLEGTIPQEVHRTRLEFVFSQAQPFLQAMVLYLIVLLCALLSWLKWPKTLGKTALILLLLSFLIHTAGLSQECILQGRPPVTNLYSSAIFVGWGSVLLCLFLERFYQNGIGSVCASAIGFVTLLIAQNLQLDGDTLEMFALCGTQTSGWRPTSSWSPSATPRHF
jgi:hypothetical protein